MIPFSIPSLYISYTSFPTFFQWLHQSLRRTTYRHPISDNVIPLHGNMSTFFFLNYYLFIYLFMAVLGLRFCARAFSSCGEQGPLFIVVRGPLTIVASLVAEHRLQTHRLSSCGSRAQLLRGTWDLPRPGLEPVSPASAGRFSTTAPPGKPQCCRLFDTEIQILWSQRMTTWKRKAFGICQPGRCGGMRASVLAKARVVYTQRPAKHPLNKQASP